METLQGTNISHLGKRKIIFKMPFLGDMLVPWRVFFAEFFFVLVVFLGGKKERKEERLVRW